MQDSQRKSIKGLIYIQLLAFSSFTPMNYYNVYLREIGFDSTQLGFWGAALGLTGMCALSVWGLISDKTRSPRLMFLFSMAIYAIVFTLIPFAGSNFAKTAIPLYILILLYGSVKEPTHSLQDAWMISTIAPFRGVSYASIRMWGSLGFGIISILFSLVSDALGISKVFYAAPILVLPTIILLLTFKQPETASSVKRTETVKINPLTLFKNYYYVTALIMTLVLGTYVGMTQSFYAYILENAGVSPGQVGLISGYGSLLQVGCMWAVGKYCRNIPAPKLLIIGGLFGVLENVMYGLSSGLGMLMIAATFWGFAISARVSVLPSYLFSLVPREYTASAQTLNSTVVMMLSVIGNILGGFLVANMGIVRYNFTVAAAQALLILLFSLSIPFGQKVLKIPPPAAVTGHE